MSLHLIESRDSLRCTARRPGGTALSLLLHAAFATALLTLATKSPGTRPPKPTDEHTIYTAERKDPPPPPRAPAQTQTNLQPHTTAFAAPATIPNNIPPIDIAVAPVDMPSLSNALSVDYGAAVGQTGTIGSTGPSNLIVQNTVLSDLQVDKPVLALPGARAPKYPDTLRAAGIEDTVIATFIVDTLGRVEAASFEVNNRPRTPFVVSVRDALMATKFKPAEAQGHPVRQRVVQAFVFSLTR
jgi:protein TonB